MTKTDTGRAVRYLMLATVAILAPACGTSKGGTVIQPVISMVTISSMTATPAAVAPGGGVVLAAAATDSAGGTLSYAWMAPSGSLSTSAGNPVTWTAPLSTGTVLIQLTATSTTGSSATAVVSVVVSVGSPGAVITSVNPAEVSVGDEIQVMGSGFGGIQGASSLTVSGIATTNVLWSDTLIRAIVPSGAKTGTVLVLLAGGQSNPGFIAIVWPATYPQNVPICTAAGHQDNPQIVSDGSGGAIMTWTDPRSGTGYDIYAQRVNNAGAVQWTTDGVAICTAVGNQFNPQIVSDGSGGAVVVWYDRRSGTNYDLYAQRVDGAGTVQWTADGVAICTAAGDQDAPKMLMDGAGGAIVVWQDRRNGANNDLYAQRVNGSGAVQWITDGVTICTAVNDQYDPQILSDGLGGAIMVWQDNRSGSPDIYAQRMNGAGAVQWATDGVAVCTAAFAQAYPQLVSDGSGGATVVWQDQRNASNDIYAQRMNNAGVVQWPVDGVIICTAAGSQVNPHTVSDGLGGAIILWQDSRSGTNNDIYAQRVNGAGAVQWTIDGVAISTATNAQPYSQLVSDGSGGAIILWRDIRSGNYDIYAQRVNGAGAIQWPINGVSICSAANDQGVPQLVSDGSDGAIIVWTDFRSGMWYDIYTQGIR